MKFAFVLVLACVAFVAVQAMELEPGEPATNPFQKAAAAKETVSSVPSTPLNVANPVSAQLLVAKNGAASAAAFLEVNPNSISAPVPPPGAVKSASEVASTVKPTAPVPASKPAAPVVSKAAIEATQFLKGIQKKAPKASLKLSSKWLETIQTRLDAIRDAQDAAPKAIDEQDRVRNSAAKLIARQIQKVLEKSAETLKKAESGKLTEADIKKLTLGSKAAAALKNPSAAAAAAIGKNANGNPKKINLKNANSLLPPGVKAPKAPADSPKSSYSYGSHANNPKHKLKNRKNRKFATPPQLANKPTLPPRFQQLPVGVVGDGHNEMLLKTVDAVMSLDNPSRDYKGHVSTEGKLCPTCQEIKYNADSPLSDDDKKLLHKQHADLVLGDAKLHSQSVLDRATLMVDDATDARKAMLDKYPPQSSLIQFDSHN